MTPITGGRRRLTWLAVLGATLTLLSCGPADVDPSVVRRDSAGVEVVESHRPSWGPGEAWRVDPEPALDLSRTGEGAEHEFFRVDDATRRADGSIVVAERSTAQVRFYAADGSFIRTVGGPGEGPGEFGRPAGIHVLRDDSILVFDRQLVRFTWLGPDGGLGRVERPFAPEVRLNEVHLVGGGRLIGIRRLLEALGDVVGLYRTPYVVLRLDPASGVIDSIAELPGFQGYSFEQGDAAPLFYREGQVAVLGDRLFLGASDSMEIAERSLEGDLVRVIRIPGYDLTVTDEELAAERATRIPENGPEFLREVGRSMPAVETRPAYGDLLVDPTGAVWAVPYRGFADVPGPVECEVFGPDGEWLGSVALPEGFTAFEIGIDYVLGVREDEGGVERVQVLGLQRGDG